LAKYFAEEMPLQLANRSGMYQSQAVIKEAKAIKASLAASVSAAKEHKKTTHTTPAQGKKLHELSKGNKSNADFKAFLKAHPNLDVDYVKLPEGFTAVHLTAGGAQHSKLGLLMDAKASVNPVAADGRTPLHWVAEKAMHQAAQVLLKNKADVFFKDKKGRTPYEAAAQSKHKHRVQMCQLLYDEMHKRNPALAGGGGGGGGGNVPDQAMQAAISESKLQAQLQAPAAQADLRRSAQ
jgi:hypothetical protein